MNRAGLRARGHEPEALDARVLGRLALGLALATPLVVAATYLFYRAQMPSRAPLQAGSVPPPPRLQAQPLADRIAARAEQDARLDRYTWVDRRAGLARIPIERAMALVAGGVATAASAPEPTEARSR